MKRKPDDVMSEPQPVKTVSDPVPPAASGLIAMVPPEGCAGVSFDTGFTWNIGEPTAFPKDIADRLARQLGWTSA